MTHARALALVMFGVAGCPEPTKLPEVVINQCADSAACPNGHVCVDGACIPGACDPSLACTDDGTAALCCKPWQLCSDTLRCEPDPVARGVGCDPADTTCTPCEVTDDCAEGQFCSAQACLNVEGRTACSNGADCADGERCDTSAFLCVADNGGCAFCATLPELCCDAGQVCSEAAGGCLPDLAPPCTTFDDCAVDASCVAERCVLCVDDTACGPGLVCDDGTGSCYSPPDACFDNADCTGSRLCNGDGNCVVPACAQDAECHFGGDERRFCDLSTFECVLPPPECTETDESNNDLATATLLDESYAGVLCRGDTDMFAFTVEANHRYIATVDFGGSGQPGIAVSMLDTGGAVESSNVFAQTDASVQVIGASAANESGAFYVRVIGSNIDRDQWDYIVTLTDLGLAVPVDCSPQGQMEEPNDTADTAYALGVGGTTTFTRCGVGDVDYLRIPIAPLHGVQVVVAGFDNFSGNLDAELFGASAPTVLVSRSATTNSVEIVDGPEGESAYLLSVFVVPTQTTLDNQIYTVTVTDVPRPPACASDLTEDDGSLALAAPLLVVDNGDGTVSATTTAVRCNAQDLDFFSFTMPPGLSGSVLTSFNHNDGDMRLDLFDATTGALLVSSNVSNAGTEPDEQVAIPGNPVVSVEYVAKVSLASVLATNIVGQPYSISLVTFDNSQCLASEPAGGDDTFGTGRCIGAFTPDAARPCDESARAPEPLAPGDLATCDASPNGTPGCGRVCGNTDSDFYRLGVLNNQRVIHAALDFTPSEGALSLVLDRLSSTGIPTTVQTQNDTNGDGHIDLVLTVASTQPNLAREHAVRVRPSGTTGHQSELYSLSISVGDECFDDQNEAGAGNETPAERTLIRPNAQPSEPLNFDSSTAFTPPSSRCGGDVDVYELLAFGGETVTVTLAGPTGLVAELGTTPAVLSDPAVLVDSVDANAGPLVFGNGVAQTLYVTVKAIAGVVVTGPYALTITTTP